MAWVHVFRRHQAGVVAKHLKLATEMMRADAGLHADQAGRKFSKPCFHLATRPLLTQHHDHRGRRRGTSSCQYQCRLRKSVLLQAWRAPYLRRPWPAYRLRDRSTAGPSHYRTSARAADQQAGYNRRSRPETARVHHAARQRGSSDRVYQSVALRHFGNTWPSNALQCLVTQQLPRSVTM
jgi:hypothetical protein